MSGFVLRHSTDVSNPTATRPFGEQSTQAMLAYWRNDTVGTSPQTFFIVLLGEGEHLFHGETSTNGFHGEGFYDSIVWFRYNGFLLTPYDSATGVGDYIFHPGYETDPALGYADPAQGRPRWFPELDFSFSGRPYCEVRLPVNLSLTITNPSTDTSEPTGSQIRLKTTCLWDYDTSGSRVGPKPTFTSNNMRIIAFMARCAGIDIANRFDWPSWCAMRDKCDELIGWQLGGGDGLTGEYFSGDPPLTTLTQTKIDQMVSFVWGQSSPLSSGRPTWTTHNATINESSGASAGAGITNYNSGVTSSMPIPCTLVGGNCTGVGKISAVLGSGGTVIVGLSTSGSHTFTSFNEINYGFLCNLSGHTVNYILNGVGTPLPGVLCNPNDEFTLEVSGTTVTFKKNGAVLSIPESVPARTTDLYAVVAFAQTGSSISSATMNPSPSGVGIGAFSVRWTGFFEPPKTDDYAFIVNSNDGVRLWVNDVELVNDWTAGEVRERSGTISLTGSTMYPIKIEYENLSGQSQISLSYSSATISKQPIPQAQLFSSAAVLVTTPTDTGRRIARFDGDVAFTGVGWPAALDQMFVRCPGIKWQVANGKIYFLWANDRTPVKKFIYERGIPFLVDPFNDLFYVLNAQHGLANDDILVLSSARDSSGNTLPPAINARFPYYVVQKTAVNFKLSLTLGGAPVSLAGINGYGTYTMYSNIVQSSVTGQRTDPTTKINFLVIGFRNRDDDQLVQAYAEVNRTDLRDLIGGKEIDPGILQIGVARQSLAERIGEAYVRRLSDRDLEVNFKGQKDAHNVAIHDLIEMVHPRGDWRLTPFAGHPAGPITLEIVQEAWESTFSTANEKSFIGRIWSQEYDDTAHGPLIRRPPGYVPSAFDPPPAVTLVTLAERLWNLANGTSVFAIDGQATFSNLYQFGQEGSVWWRRPNDEIEIPAAAPTSTSNGIQTATDVITVAGHGYFAGTPVMFRATGTLPSPLDPALTYFVTNRTLNTFKVALTFGGSAIDITDVGSGTHYVAPFVKTNQNLKPAAGQAEFTLQGAAQGVHQIKVVAQSPTGQQLSFEQHPTWSIYVAQAAATLLKIFDNVPPKDVDMGLGLTIGGAKSPGGAGLWLGMTLFRDRGFGPEEVAVFDGETTIGYTIDHGVAFLGGI